MIFEHHRTRTRIMYWQKFTYTRAERTALAIALVLPDSWAFLSVDESQISVPLPLFLPCQGTTSLAFEQN